ncbi:ATP-binding protein [Candidatus Woesearchaeota archaeon]|nr:ATP-binding protein [Candidatus Woesearchaeota archaeon]
MEIYHNNFKIEIEDANSLYDKILTKDKTKIYDLGKIQLSSIGKIDIIDSIETILFAHGNKFYNFFTRIINPLNLDNKIIDIPLSHLMTRYELEHVDEKDSNFNNEYPAFHILDDNKKLEYIILNHEATGDLLVYNGIPPDGIRAITLKKLAKYDSFDREFNYYKEIVRWVVNGVYNLNGRNSPDVTFNWKPQEKDIDFWDGFQNDEIEFMPEPNVSRKKGLLENISIERPNITFKDVGGQKKAKKEIASLSFAIKNPKLYESWGTTPAKGILLHGPPGTGKTLMAKALANEAEAVFYNVKVSDITNMWYGQSEKYMQEVFDLAKNNHKTIIFFDELDSLARDRYSSHEASGRILTVMQENLDGISNIDNVMVVGSTNLKDKIDPALLRPGRFDRLIEVPLPDREGRYQIFEIHMKNAQNKAKRHLFEPLNIEKILDMTNDYSGADIAEIVRRTLEEKVRVHASTGKEPGKINTPDLLNEINNYERNKDTILVGFTKNQ